jgi:hypothetical protein
VAKKRSNPTLIGMDAGSPEEQMCSDMHSALHTLSDKVRKPYSSSGDHLLPKPLQANERPEAKQARKHIRRLHKAFKSEK